MRTVRASWIIIGVFCVILLGMPFKYDTVIAKASGCTTGNRWGQSDINSSVNATGYIYYYSPTSKSYKKFNFDVDATIKKTGTSKTLVKKKGTDLDSKYDDTYAISIFSKFKLTCNQCGADVTRTRSASE